MPINPDIETNFLKTFYSVKGHDCAEEAGGPKNLKKKMS
jgi:hypothetical protein